MLYKFDQHAPISTYYTVCAKDANEALQKLKHYLHELSDLETEKGIKGMAFHTYHKWRTAMIFELPEDYYVEELDPLVVMEHERI